MDYPIKWKCPNCSEMVDNNKSCPKCKFMLGSHYPSLWNCPNCNNITSKSEFCKICSYPNNLSYPKLWHCHECSNLVKDSETCEVCGFKITEKKPEPAPVIEKKIRKNDFMDKKNIYLMSIGVIVLSLILVFYSIDFSQKEEASAEIAAGQIFSRDFALATNLESVTFELESPTGQVLIVEGSKKSSNIWSITNISLNESGTWTIKILGLIGLSTFESSGTLNVKNSCTNNSECLSSLCCEGACFNPCKSNLECDDFNSLTSDSCINIGTCDALCVNSPLECNTIARDGYCPTNCNKDNDVDCASCLADEAVCNGVCKKLECDSNSDCADNDPRTADKCIIMNNPCSNFCENSYYSGSCPEGKVEYDGYCVTPACMTAEDCKRDGWNYNCLYAGAINSYCSYSQCASGQISCPINGVNKCITPACKRNAECGVSQVCQNAWTCNALCVTIPSQALCKNNEFFCNGSCTDYNNLCSWPKAPKQALACDCDDSEEYLIKRSETIAIPALASSTGSDAESLSVLCSGCNSMSGNCFNGKAYRMVYTISYDGDAAINAPILGLSKSYDYAAASTPPQTESRNEYLSGVINCNNNNNISLSSELSATMNNIMLIIESDELAEIPLAASGNNYTLDVCPEFNNSQYKITFDAESLESGEFVMRYGLDSNNKVITLSQVQQGVVSGGVIDCSKADNNITFAGGAANVKFFATGCFDDFGCAKNELDKCSLTKCVSNKCQTQRLNFSYCQSGANETIIAFSQVSYTGADYKSGSYYLANSTICEDNVNHGKEYIINAEITAINDSLLIGYEADSKGTMLIINSPQRIVISGTVDCSRAYGAVVFYLPASSTATGFTVSSFSMHIKNYASIISPPKETAEDEESNEPATPEPKTCNWPFELTSDMLGCELPQASNAETTIIALEDLETKYELFSNAYNQDLNDLKDDLCTPNNYNGKEFYFSYSISYYGAVNLDSEIIGLKRPYSNIFIVPHKTVIDSISGTIDCSKNTLLLMTNALDYSKANMTSARVYIKNLP